MARKTPRIVTDEQWELIAPHLPGHPPGPKGGRPRADDRECLEGLLWYLRTGARWRDLPIDLPSGSTCWRRLVEWAGEDVLWRLQGVLIEQLGDRGKLALGELFADATFIRAKRGAPRSARPSAARA
jgi:transposase